MSISILFTVVHMGDDLDADSKRQVAKRKAAYHILHVRNNRTFVQATLESVDDIDPLLTMIDGQGRNTIICGGWYKEGHQLGQSRTWNPETEEWDISGTPTYQINNNEIINQQPDIVEIVENLPVINRSLTVLDNYKLAGWENKNGF